MGSVSATPAALELIDEIVADHGPVMFHQSGGCCDGSSPMCYAQGDFLIGDYDVKMGEIGGAPFYISGSQYEAWKHTDIVIDVVPGRGRHVLARQRPREALPRPLGNVRDPCGREGLSRGRSVESGFVDAVADRVAALSDARLQLAATCSTL